MSAFDFYFSQIEVINGISDVCNGAEVLLTKLVKGQVYEDLEENKTVPHGTWRKSYSGI